MGAPIGDLSNVTPDKRTFAAAKKRITAQVGHYSAFLKALQEQGDLEVKKIYGNAITELNKAKEASDRQLETLELRLLLF